MASDEVRGAYDALAPIYDQAYSDAVSLAEDHALGLALRVAVDAFHIPVVVDFGCGTGHALTIIKRFGGLPHRYTGIDLSREMIVRMLLKHPEARSVSGPAGLRVLPSESANVVVSTFGMLSYVSTPRTVIGNMAAVLIPGGRFVIQAYGRRYHDGKSLCSSLPCRLYSVAELEGICSSAGLEVSRAWSTGAILRRLPSSLPAAALRAAAVAERVAGRALADHGRFLTVEGRRV